MPEGSLVSPEVLERLFDDKFGIWRLSPRCDHIELDEAGARLLGVPPFCPLPTDLPQIARFLSPLRQSVCLAGQTRFDLTFPFERSEGTQAWLYVNAQRDEASGMLFGIVKDVTRYKALEMEARASEGRLRAILENLPGICYRCQPDPPWRMTFVNAEVEAITGHCPAAFLEGRIVWEDLILPEDREIVRKEVASAISTNGRFDIRYRIRDRAGTVRWVFERGSAQMDEAGIPLEIEGFIFDITEAMQVRHRLQEAEDRYRLVCQSTMDLIYEEDLILHRVTCHSEQETFLGHHLSSIPAESSWWMERVHPEDRPRLLSEITEALAGNSSCFASRHRFERADGGHADMLATAFVQRDLAGKPVKLIGALQDLSRHQAMVAALNASEALNRSIVNASQDCIKLLDLEGKLLFINAFGLQVMGFEDAKSVIGRSLLSFWPRETHRRIRKALARARAGETGHYVG
ncbi:MAG: PAS domain-containing protein, partial [Novosphingobium sp.]|nr:PAS domain-containing protein [Novosphingobium sp.]